MKATKTQVTIPGVTLELTEEEALLLGRITERLRLEVSLAAAVKAANEKMLDIKKFPQTNVRLASTLMTKLYFELAKLR